MSNYPNVIIPTSYHLVEISRIFHNFPPEVLANGVRYPNPYTMDTIASKAVKAAATPLWSPLPDGGWVGKPTDELAAEMRTYLAGYDNQVTADLIRQVYVFIDYLIHRFVLHGWYVEGESPYRFIGFTHPYSNTYDIVVRCG